MEAQEDKNKQNQGPEDVKTFEQDMKNAYKADDYDAVKAAYDKLIRLDAGNRLAQKLMQKMEKIKEKKAEAFKEEKAKEYVDMLKKLYKERDIEKLTALVKEFKDFDSENKHAIKWEMRVQKLKEKLTGKTEEKPAEVKPLNIGIKKEEKGAKEERKGGIMGLMAKRAEESAKAEVKPVIMAPVKPPVVPQPVTPVPVKPPVVPQPVTPAPSFKEAPKEAKGNLFTSMFGKEGSEMQKKSIIDTIVAKTEKKQQQKTERKEEVKKEALKPIEKAGEVAGLLTFSKIFMNFAIIFIVFSAIFLYVEWIDKQNTVLGLAGISENTGGKLHNAALTLEDLQKKEEELNKDIELYKGGYDDKAVKTVEKIISERINWPDVFDKIKQVTNSVYELNDFFKYIEYNNYSLDVERGAIRVSGTLSDPLGRNLTKLVELEEAFKYYPKDRNNPEDTTKPYFTGFNEFTSFSKSLDKETGRYNSNFQLSFSINK